MPRVIIMSGKGGVGKTTVAAATGLSLARRGYRTVVLSFDLAHSLSDSFDIDESLFSKAKGTPINVAENLDIQEIDVQEELERHWGDVYRYMAMLMAGNGIDDVVAEETAIMPGMEDVIALLYINDYVTAKQYDVIVVDSPPTTDSLRFVSITSSIDWYVRKRMRMDRNLAKVARPILTRLSQDSAMLPEDGYFSALQRLFDRLHGVDKLIHDPEITTVRLVTTPDRMVIRETQRAFMYFCLYGMSIDQLVVNRMLPSDNAYFGEWAKTQQKNLEDMEAWSAPVPSTKLPFKQNEVCGVEALESLIEDLEQGRDLSEIFVKNVPYRFDKESNDAYTLTLDLPFATKEMVDISRNGEDFVVRVGSFKRMIVLPRAVVPLAAAKAHIDNSQLVVKFERGA
jgi:arsenite-transporting ATPase